MADKAWGCIMADEMGLGGSIPNLARLGFVAHNDRKDTTVYRTAVDLAQAISYSRQADVRESDRSVSHLASWELGKRIGYVSSALLRESRIGTNDS
jgi:hypothetical protein